MSVVVKFSKIIKARKERFFSCDNLTRLKKLRGRKGQRFFLLRGGGGGRGSLAGFDSILGKCESYSATTRTGALGRRLSNHNVFLKTKDSQISCNGPMKFKHHLRNR